MFILAPQRLGVTYVTCDHILGPFLLIAFRKTSQQD